MDNSTENAENILAKLNAIQLFQEKGLDEAVRVYPECRDFLYQNKSNPVSEVRATLEMQLMQAR